MTFSSQVDIPPTLFVIDADICLSGLVTGLVKSIMISKSIQESTDINRTFCCSCLNVF